MHLVNVEHGVQQYVPFIFKHCKFQAGPPLCLQMNERPDLGDVAAVSAPSPPSGTLITVGMAALEAEPVSLLLLKNG